MSRKSFYDKPAQSDDNCLKKSFRNIKKCFSTIKIKVAQTGLHVYLTRPLIYEEIRMGGVGSPRANTVLYDNLSQTQNQSLANHSEDDPERALAMRR